MTTQQFYDQIGRIESIDDCKEQLTVVRQTIREIELDMYKRGNIVYAYVEIQTVGNTLEVVINKVERFLDTLNVKEEGD